MHIVSLRAIILGETEAEKECINNKLIWEVKWTLNIINNMKEGKRQRIIKLKIEYGKCIINIDI